MTAEELALVWKTRVERHGPAMRNELRRFGQKAVQLSRIKMRNEIYSKPPDFSKSGRPKWIQTGNLLLSEELVEESSDSFALVNTASYAEPRHEANKPGRRQINPARTAHWQDDTMAQLKDEMPEAFSRMQLRIFSEGPE